MDIFNWVHIKNFRSSAQIIFLFLSKYLVVWFLPSMGWCDLYFCLLVSNSLINLGVPSPIISNLLVNSLFHLQERVGGEWRGKIEVDWWVRDGKQKWFDWQAGGDWRGNTQIDRWVADRKTEVMTTSYCWWQSQTIGYLDENKRISWGLNRM